MTVGCLLGQSVSQYTLVYCDVGARQGRGCIAIQSLCPWHSQAGRWAGGWGALGAQQAQAGRWGEQALGRRRGHARSAGGLAWGAREGAPGSWASGRAGVRAHGHGAQSAHDSGCGKGARHRRWAR